LSPPLPIVQPLPTIHMFWHGPALSRIERLSMASFVAHGHRVRLHVYEEPLAGPLGVRLGVPAGVEIADASAVLPRSELFLHARTGSVAIFADWFRYRLLYEHGGVWADTDVVCLKPFTYPQAEIFAWEDEAAIGNSVLGLPAHHELAEWMVQVCENPHRALPYDDGRTRRRKWRRRWLEGNRRGNVRWGETGPQGFTQAARHLGQAHKALPFWHFYPLHYRNWRAAFDGSLAGNVEFLGQSRALHLWNEMTRREPGFDRNGRYAEDSLFESLWRRYLAGGAASGAEIRSAG
jgi:hypothetical protein